LFTQKHSIFSLKIEDFQWKLSIEIVNDANKLAILVVLNHSAKDIAHL